VLGTLAVVATAQRDPVVTLYRTLLVYGLAALVILTAGLVEFLHFEPFGVTAGVRAHIAGVYAYDPSTGQTSGPDRSTFTRSEQFAAVVNWSDLPDNITVQAVWYDSFGNIVGQDGPGKPSDLDSHRAVPAEKPSGLKLHLPGQYIFAVERLQGGQPVEVLARRLIEVERT
jgi:hypothetical protein